MLPEPFSDLFDHDSRDQEHVLLFEIVSAANAAESIAELAGYALDILERLLPSSGAFFLICDEPDAHLRLAQHRGISPELQAALGALEIPRPFFALLHDATTVTEVRERVLQTVRAHSVSAPLLIQLHAHNALVGIIVLLGEPHPEIDTESEAPRGRDEFFKRVGAQVGIAVKRLLLLERMRAQDHELNITVERMHALSRTGRLIQYAPNAKDGLPLVATEIREALRASYVVFHLLREDHFEIVTASDARETECVYPIAPYESRLLETDDPFIVTDSTDSKVSVEQRAVFERLKMRSSVSVRLYAHATKLGLLFVNQETPRVWDASEIQLIQAFAQQIAYALENKRLLDAIQQQVRVLHALARVSRLINAAPHPEDALRAVTVEIAQVFAADYVSLQMRDGDSLVLIADSREVGAPHRLPIYPHQWIILHELHPLAVNDSTREPMPAAQKHYLDKFQIIADLGVPLVAGQESLGILYLCQYQPRTWTEADLELALTFAQQITSTLVNARLFQESHLQISEFAAFSRSANLLIQSRSLDSSLAQAAAELRQVLLADVVSFHLVDGNQFRIYSEAHVPQNGTRYPIELYHHPVLYHSQRLVVADRNRYAKDADHLERMEHENLSAEVGVAIQSPGKILGILFVGQQQPREWTPGEVRRIEVFATQIARTLDAVQELNEKDARLQELLQLADLHDLTSTSVDEDVLLNTVFTPLLSLLKADRVGFTMLRDGKVQPIITSDGVHYSKQPIAMTPVLQEHMRSRDIIIMDELHHREHDGDYAARARVHKLQAYILVPLVAADENLGLLSFIYTTPQTFTANELRLAQTAGNQVALAVANARHLQKQHQRYQTLDGRLQSTLAENDTIRAMLGSATEGFLQTDLSGIVTTWSERAEQITGIPGAEMLGKAWHLAGPRVGPTRGNDFLAAESLADGTLRRANLARYWMHPEGRELVLAEVAAPFRDPSGAIHGATVMFWERGILQAQEGTYLDALDHVAHALDTTLSAALAAAGQLRDRDLSENRRADYTRVLGGTTSDLLNIHQHLTALSHEHSAREPLSELVDLTGLLHAQIMRARATKTHHPIHRQRDYGSVRADPERLAYVIDVLFQHALRAAPPHTRLDVRARHLSPETLELTIHHRGPSPHLAEAARHFGPGIYTSVPGPDGELKLWLLRTKVRECGGELRVESAKRTGTRFVITLRAGLPSLPGTE